MFDDFPMVSPSNLTVSIILTQDFYALESSSFKEVGGQ